MERPLDLLNSLRNKDIIVELKNGTMVEGKLKAFDLNINVTLENGRFISGGNIVLIRKKG